MSCRSPQRQTPERDVTSPLPPINERLAYLRPSRELLEFYRRKVSEFDGEHEDMMKVLDTYRSTYEEQHKLQWEMRQREGEIAELQKALSDMQVYLFQEREHALRLYAENDRLKIRRDTTENMPWRNNRLLRKTALEKQQAPLELDDRKKIQHLLALVGPDDGEITYFHKEPPHKVTISQKKVQPSDQSGREVTGTTKPVTRRTVSKSAGRAESPASPESYKKDNQTLLLQVEALQAQMEEQTKLAKEQVESLLEDRRIRMEEAQVQHQRDQDRITTLTDKLHRTQTLLYESTKDFLQLKFEGRANEKGWMAEKDRLLRDLDTCQERLREGQDIDHEPSHLAFPPDQESRRVYSQEVKSLEEQLKQAHHLADMYREQCVGLETELSRIREEGDVGREIFKDRSGKMAKRLQLMTQRYEALEKRRSMEVEGFKTDIKHLRQRLKDVEKQLFKVTLNVGPDQDLAILHEVRQTNTRSRKIQGELKTLKAKIYGLENELRYC